MATESDWKSIFVELLGSEVRFITGEHYTTRVIEAGSGEPLILLHGGGGHAEAYARNVMNLANHYHVYAVDMLYHGMSSMEPGDAEDYQHHMVAAILEMMDIEGLPWAHFEGESMGAHITFRLGLDHPNRCGKLIINTGHQVNFRKELPKPLNSVENAFRLSREYLDNPTTEGMRERLNWLMTTPDRVTDELVDLRVRIWALPETAASMRRIFNGAYKPRQYEEEDCAKLTPPVLVFWTEFNPSNPPETGEYMASLIPGAKYYCMKDAAHWPQWEHPVEHDDVVVKFLQGKL